MGGLFLCSKNGNFGEEGGLGLNSLCGGGTDIFWNYSVHNGNSEASTDDLHY